MMMPHDRQLERCWRRAAGLIVTGDILLCASEPSPFLLASLEYEERSALQVVTPTTLRTTPTLCVAIAQAGGDDGSLAFETSQYACVMLALRFRIPCYALLPHGPRAGATIDPLLGSNQWHVVDAEQVAAIITDRGIYRPAMLTRHHSEGEAPLDVIPLIG
ncbi:MAG: hypothetical protein Fur005_47500 [Roseiflexaceae bacterium]